jgi:hypothetical protein
VGARGSKELRNVEISVRNVCPLEGAGRKIATFTLVIEGVGFIDDCAIAMNAEGVKFAALPGMRTASGWANIGRLDRELQERLVETMESILAPAPEPPATPPLRNKRNGLRRIPRAVPSSFLDQQEAAFRQVLEDAK